MRVADDPCDAITGPAQAGCNSGGGSSGGVGNDSNSLPESLDPVNGLAQSVAKAGAWTARQVGEVLGGGKVPTVDLTNAAFLKQYAVVFAASVFIVMLLWLLAVVKRVLRAVPLMTAIGESVGLLWLSVAITAFAPLALYVIMQASSGLAQLLGKALGADGSAFEALAVALEDGKVGGGPIILLLVSLLSIVLCGAVWLLMVLRALGLYVGALAGIPVLAGLVDRDFWGHSKRWAAMMAGIIAIEPVLIVIVGMAAAVQATGDVVTGIGVTAIGLGATVMLITKIPGWGESVKVMRQTARGMGTAGGMAMGTVGAAGSVLQGISAHGGREGGGGTGRANNTSKDSGSGGVSGGLSAHSNRTPKKPPEGDTK